MKKKHLTVNLVMALLFVFTLYGIAADPNTDVFGGGKGKQASIGDGSRANEVRAETVPPEEIDWQTVTEAGSNIKFWVDKKGTPTIVCFTGMAYVPRTMVPIEARQFAYDTAEENAKAAFATWMKENFTIATSTENKSMIVIAGNGTEGSTISRSEESETSIKRKKVIERFAQGQWRGIRKIWHHLNDKNEYYAVYRWSVKESELARLVEQLTRGLDADTGKPATMKHSGEVKTIPPSFLP